MSTRLLTRLALTALLGAATGCLPSLSLDPDGGSPNHPGKPDQPNGTDDGGVVLPGADLLPPPDLAIDPVQEFNAQVAPILEMSCAGCHNKSGGVGPGFLEPNPDVLTTLLAYPGMVGPSPETSRIYVKGVHEGPGLTAVEKPIVADWIKLWAIDKPKDPTQAAKPEVKPFAPTMGDNTIDLSVLGAQFTGMKVTFTAGMVGTSLQLSNITVVAAPTTGIHIAHPLWVMWSDPQTAVPDPVDSFSNLDETVDPGQTAPMGPGLLFLPNFASSMTLNLVFQTLETKGGAGMGDGGVTVLGCKNVPSWSSNTKPQLMANCTSCHGGSNTSATSALPLQSANGDTQNCANTLGEINLTTPASSRLFTYPDPNAPNNGHPFHFPDGTTYQNFQNAVGQWIANEK